MQLIGRRSSLVSILLAAEAILTGFPGCQAAPMVEERSPRRLRPANISTTSTTTTTSATPKPTAPSWWVPDQSTTWQIQLGGNVNPNVPVQAIEIDADTDKATVTKIKASGKKIIAYISAGSWEDWRDDAAVFPKSVIGKDLDGWPGENWLDVRQTAILRPILTARAAIAKAKGFDGIDWDNVDGYTQDSGFTISYAQQITYNKMLADIAHSLGMSVALKNNLDQAKDLAPFFDYAVNESCSFYQECDMLAPFLNIGKAVVGLEYPGFNGDKRSQAQVAAQTDKRTYTLIKKQDLTARGVAVRTMKQLVSS